MCEGAGILEGTEAGELPVLAQFCLILGTEILLDNRTRSLVVLGSRVEESFIAIVFLGFKRLRLRNEFSPKLLSLTLLSVGFLHLIVFYCLVVSSCKERNSRWIFWSIVKERMREQLSCHLMLGLHGRHKFLKVWKKGQTSAWGCAAFRGVQIRDGQRLFFNSIHLVVHQEMLSLDPAGCLRDKRSPRRGIFDRSFNWRSWSIETLRDGRRNLEWSCALACDALPIHLNLARSLRIWDHGTLSCSWIECICLLCLLYLQICLNLMQYHLGKGLISEDSSRRVERWRCRPCYLTQEWLKDVRHYNNDFFKYILLLRPN